MRLYGWRMAWLSMEAANNRMAKAKSGRKSKAASWRRLKAGKWRASMKMAAIVSNRRNINVGEMAVVAIE
jgi:hypothetical protein